MDSGSHEVVEEIGPGDSLAGAVGSPPVFWWGDVIGLALVAMCIFVGNGFWREWCVSPDRVLFLCFTGVGLLFGLVRSNWRGLTTRTRTLWACTLWAFSSFFLLAGLFSEGTFALALASSFAFAGWYTGRIRGEVPARGLLASLAFLVPPLLLTAKVSGLFEVISRTTVSMTAALVDLSGQPYAREDGKLLFGLGIAEQFTSFGVWDGAVTVLGLALGLSLAFRRNLLVALLSFGTSILVWISIRSVFWFWISYASFLNQTWYPWTLLIEIGLFLSCCLITVGIDYFYYAFFEPIPLESDMESPIASYSWNWLCGLPSVLLPVPTTNTSYGTWNQLLTDSDRKPSVFTNFQWLMKEYFLFFTSPKATFGAMSDANRGWFYSRKWLGLGLGSFAIAIPVFLIGLFGFVVYGNYGKGVQTLVDASLQLCSTERLQEVSNKAIEADFCKAIGIVPPTDQATDQELRSEELSKSDLRYLELLTRRILVGEPDNQLAHYRLGLVYSLQDQPEKAIFHFKELASGRFGVMPSANDWMAKNLIVRRAKGESIESDEVIKNIQKARGWPEVDHRLLIGLASLLAGQGKSQDAVDVLKQAVSLQPELIVELASLYRSIDHEDFQETAKNAEAFFLKRIDIPSEKEVDRMSVAEVRVLLGQLDQAEAILLEGLERGIGGERTKRQLSEVQFRIYLASIKKLDNGEFSADLALLEKAAATDSSNPNISAGVARLIALKIKPTAELLNTLKQQIKSGTTSVAAHLSLGEGYFGTGRIEEAQEHWELALQGDPNSVVGLNNLALSLSQLQPPNLQRALELASRAHAIAPQNPSVLDTFGEILLIADRPKEAVNKLELAIRYDNTRIETRKKLVIAYQAAGLNDMASAQSAVIEQIESANKGQEPQSQQRDND
jgi:tetratricopeptide (TPR) repeat protein